MLQRSIVRRLTKLYEKGFAEGRRIGCRAGMIFGALATYSFALTMVIWFPETQKPCFTLPPVSPEPTISLNSTYEYLYAM
jgi:hypothetical protein